MEAPWGQRSSWGHAAPDSQLPHSSAFTFCAPSPATGPLMAAGGGDQLLQTGASTGHASRALAATLASAQKQRVGRVLGCRFTLPWSQWNTRKLGMAGINCDALLHHNTGRSAASLTLVCTLPPPARMQELAECTLQSLQAAMSKAGTASAADKENSGCSSGAVCSSRALQPLPPLPMASYSHQRVSPGHFLVNPTRSPLQQQPQQAAATSAAPATLFGTPVASSGSAHWAHSGPAAAAPAAAAAVTPLSQARSCASSAHSVDNLSSALRDPGGWVHNRGS